MTDKPTKAFEMGKHQDEEEIKMKLSSLTSMPKARFAYPQTQAQEIGWDMDNEFGTYVPKAPQGKKQCAETTYCDDFITF